MNDIKVDSFLFYKKMFDENLFQSIGWENRDQMSETTNEYRQHD